MASTIYNRKLTALLSTDVVGYSRLMERDEAGTIRSLTECRSLMGDLIRQHHGRVVDATGDNMLADFSSAVDAVTCAVRIQEELELRNRPLAEEERMRFRIGLNLGDVIEEEGCLYGDGVNIAARLEALAPPGGICISGAIFDQVSGKLSCDYEFLGEQTVKNIAQPVRVYRLGFGTQPSGGHKRAAVRKAQSRARHWAFTIALLMLAGFFGVYLAWKADLVPLQRSGDDAVTENAHVIVPQKPVIAVLPFENMSRDEAFDYFADGLTDDIITNLSQLSGLSVIARNSVFTYKGKPTKTQVLAVELGAQFVLEGGLRSAGEQILMNVQLIDAPSGHHVWAERYDMKVKDLFAIQVDITTQIASALKVTLTEQDKATLQEKGTAYLEAYLDKSQAGKQELLPEEKDTRAEMIFWESVKDSDSPAMFKEYLRQYPDGIFAGLARINASKPVAKKESPSPKKQAQKRETEPVPVALKEEKPAQLSHKDSASPADNTQLEETFWRSIHNADRIAEYEEFLNKFPNGLFAGLARIKIAALTEEALLRRRPGDDGKIELAILSERYNLTGNYSYVYQSKEDRARAISEGMKMALAENRLFVPKWSAFYLGKEYRAKRLEKNQAQKLSRLWLRENPFQREEPRTDDVCKVGQQIDVEAILMINTREGPYFSLLMDLFLIDVGSGKTYSETLQKVGNIGVAPTDVRDGMLKLFAYME